MGKYNQELIASGIMHDGGGLQPSSQGARVTFSGKDRMVRMGPFSNTAELVSGYWIWKCKSLYPGPSAFGAAPPQCVSSVPQAFCC
jgi:PhnB protein